MTNWLKGCPRCHGDLYGKYFACLQCGHYLSEREVDDLTNFGLGLGFPASSEVPTWALAELAA